MTSPSKDVQHQPWGNEILSYCDILTIHLFQHYHLEIGNKGFKGTQQMERNIQSYGSICVSNRHGDLPLHINQCMNIHCSFMWSVKKLKVYSKWFSFPLGKCLKSNWCVHPANLYYSVKAELGWDTGEAQELRGPDFGSQCRCQVTHNYL